MVELDSSDPQREKKLVEVLLVKGGESRLFRVENAWRHDGRPVLKLEGMASISDAEAWAGAELRVADDAVARPAEGEYSHADLVGCEVIDAGVGRVGMVEGVEAYGGPALLMVRTQDGREVLIPFARSISKEIDVVAKIIRVELPQGLLDLE